MLILRLSIIFLIFSVFSAQAFVCFSKLLPSLH
jgi:hypothetical protein